MKQKQIEIPLIAAAALLVLFTAFRCGRQTPGPTLILETAEKLEAAAPADRVLLDLNTATAEELEALPKIGPVLAQRILDWRTENGSFAVPEDVLSVKGIGEATYAAIEPYITCQ